MRITITIFTLAISIAFATGCSTIYEATDKSARYVGEGAKRWCEDVVPAMPPNARASWIAKANESADPHRIRPVDCANVDGEL